MCPYEESENILYVYSLVRDLSYMTVFQIMHPGVSVKLEK